MRGLALSTCERQFLQQSFVEDMRIDKRTCMEFRPLEVRVGSVPGTCIACMGYTKVMTRISCEMVVPKETRPAEGTLFINVEMSPLAAPAYEERRTSERGVEVTRMLERVFKESGCVDMESLCIKAGQRVWRIRCDVHVLDDDGSLCDVASVSCITALAHFRRPDVTVTPDRIVVHPSTERPLVPLSLYHYPIIVSYGFTLEEGEREMTTCMIVEPTEREELVLDGQILVGANKRDEVCALHCYKSFDAASVVKCAQHAVRRAADVAEIVQTVLNNHQKQIAAKEAAHNFGFARLVGVARRRVVLDAVTKTPGEVVDADVKEEPKGKLPPGLIPYEPPTDVSMSVAESSSISLPPSKKKPSMLVAKAEEDEMAMIVQDQMESTAAASATPSTDMARKRQRREARGERAKTRKKQAGDDDVMELVDEVCNESKQHK